MLRTVGDQPSLWEALLPEELHRLPDELARVDAWLDDERFFAPFVAFFDPRIGRPSIPMETYLRLMFLKSRYRLGFESLCREVSDSITWRHFCRVPLEVAVPHPTTLMKLTTRCGSAAVDGLNEAVLAKAAEQKVLRCRRVRADTTVVPANVAYPTDSGLLAKAIRRIAAKLRSRSAAGKDEAAAAVRRANADLVGLAETAAHDADRLLANAKRALRGAAKKARQERLNGIADPATGRRRGRLARAVNDLTELLDATRKIAAQTRQRLAGHVPAGASHRVSLHDPDARPIAKGRLGKPVDFGYKAQVADKDDGIILDHDVQAGNPPDAPRLAPAVERIARRAGRPPHTATADRGYGEAGVDDALQSWRHPGGDPPQRQPRQSQTGHRTPTNVPPTRQMAHRLRGPDQRTQTRLRMGPQPDRHPRRCSHLGRTRSPGPQPGQDHRPNRLNQTNGRILSVFGQTLHHRPASSAQHAF